MLTLITKTLTKVLGNKSARDLKTISPFVPLINAEYAKLATISDDQLRGKTQFLKTEIQKDLQSIDDELASLHKNIADNPEMDLSHKETVFAKIDKLEKERDAALEVTLMKILPQAFAVVKETARRYKENGKLVVAATMQDKALAVTKKNVEISGDQAIWHNKWLAAGTEISWDMLHYDVQLIGGIVLHQGKIAEMATGEGKTLVATLPTYLNAIAGRGVHIVTVNDYLAKRDSEWMGPLFEFHGLTIDCIDKHEANSNERRAAYLADITYGTNNEFGFDYLRDNMARDTDELVQRKQHFAMVDEVDSVLIDDARTPLIISGPIGKTDEQEFHELKPRVAKLVEAQRKITSDYLVLAKKLISEKNEKEAGLPLFRAFRGLPKNKPLIKFLSETGIRSVLLKTENHYLQENSKYMPEADEPLLFTIDEKNNSVDLTEKGVEYLTGDSEDPNLFVLPDIGMELSALEKNKTLSEEDRLTKKEAILRDYSLKSQRIHTITQLLKAYTLFEKDTEYIIVDNKVKIVDEQTGRVMEGRRYSDGLHQALEAKENVKVEDATQTYATVTLQNYFRMYHKLAGMTGTAETEAGEFWDIYKLDVIVIPTNRNITRKDMQDKVYKTTREKYNAVADEIVELTTKGRPVLVGTTSVEISELLSRMLKIRNIKHQVLNAKLHQKEADIVAEAGKASTVTIATNMAGRGTDIKLSPESKAAGGLAILGTERHESRRVDRQLRGRSGRQGDPGSSQFFVSLEDNLMRLFGSDRIARLMDRMGLDDGEVIQHSMITNSIERAQKKVEENNFATRKRLLEYDNVMNSQREVIYKRRRNALFGERLPLDILNIIFDTCDDIAANAQAGGKFEDFKLAIISTFGFNSTISEDDYKKKNANDLGQQLYNEAIAHYTKKISLTTDKLLPVLKDIHATRGATVETVMAPFADGNRHLGITLDLKKSLIPNTPEIKYALERHTSLGFMDMGWKEHLRDMDDLKQSVHNAVFEQKDPLLVYKFEGFELFKKFINKINLDIITFIFKSELVNREAEHVSEAKTEQRREKINVTKEEAKSVLNSNRPNMQTAAPEPEKIMPMKSQKVANRNDRVSVQYMNGEIKRDVKYKTVEEDIQSNKCVLIEE